LSGARPHLDKYGGMSEEQVREVSIRENYGADKSCWRGGGI